MSEIGFKGTIYAKSYIRLGLPAAPIGPKDSGVWYHQAEKMPPTRVKGWFGATVGSAEDPDNGVQLWWFNDNHLQPVLRMVMTADELRMAVTALTRLLRDRFSKGIASD